MGAAFQRGNVAPRYACLEASADNTGRESYRQQYPSTTQRGVDISRTSPHLDIGHDVECARSQVLFYLTTAMIGLVGHCLSCPQYSFSG